MLEKTLQKSTINTNKDIEISEKELNYLIQPLLTPESPKPKKRKHYFMLFFLAIIAIFAIVNFEDFVQQKEDGSYELKPERIEKIERDIQKLEEAEQYALRTSQSKYYPCPSCLHTDSIFLWIGNIWKYGTTINKPVRYSNAFLERSQLTYRIQFKGLIHECLQEEKRKIRDYPLLPENLTRTNRLARPPGNPIDK